MIVAKTVAEIREKISSEKKAGKKIAFVPTMGALHEGHLSLIKKARECAEVVVVSIFVNKAQFNDLKDFEKYPRQVERDLELLKNSGATHIFLPQDEEIFAKNFSTKIVPTKLVDCLCGLARPGHFEGVALIVSKLFNITKPDVAIFGEKDFQQLAVIKKLVHDLNFDVEILGGKTLREASGLAMSSRNQRLPEASKIKASNIFRILEEIKKETKISPQDFEKILQKKREEFLQIGFEKVDYLEIRDEENLELPKNFQSLFEAKNRIFVAVWLDGVRLIDNAPL